MTPLCERIVRDFQARKGRARKAAFRELVRAEMRKEGVIFREERAKGLIENVNLVCGNLARAEFVFGAHYDTCAELPFPNLAAPLNWPLSILTQLLLTLMLALPAALCAFLARQLGAPVAAAIAVGAACGLLASALVVAGKANRHTMNDNTSGVVALLTLLARMTQEQRGRVAVVLFDNEEVGLIGSTLFRRRHARTMADKPLVNLDCVGDGNIVLFAANKGYRADEALWARTKAAFSAGDFELAFAQRAFYPSDHWGFPKALAMATLKRRRFFGAVIDRIHTRRDTILKEENIEYIVEGLLRLIDNENA
ncbi:MAG TPA: M28 family peptidase [Candidatus Pullichristensenella avicola]|nr:M28 family peptidase [Candidatus Pullichristensenella avicola]